MFIHDKTYDIYELAKYNTHIHTHFSRCAKPEMIVADIVKAADAAGLEIIALTDHDYPNKKNAVAAQRLEILGELEKVEHNVKVLVGSELSAYGVGEFTNDIACDEALDYRLYTTNHFHQDYWKHPEVKTPRAYAEFMLAIMNSVLDMRKADCFAHPFMAGYIHAFDDPHEVTRAFTDNDIGDILTKANSLGTAWELNIGAVAGDPEFHHRYFQIGKEVGVTFNIGTDAHLLRNIDTHQFTDMLKKILY